MVEEDVVILELAGLPEVEYPDEVVDRWEKEADMMEICTTERDLTADTRWRGKQDWHGISY
jgi:hypothetical protein